MKVAALDLGSNTFLCLIAEVENGQITKVYHDEVEVVRLGQELDKENRFHPEALKRAEACLQKFAQVIATHQPQHVLAMATAAARDAENKQELFDLGAKYKIPIEIIAGGKEASITYQGAISGLGSTNDRLLVIDIGGRSTEFIFGQGPDLKSAESYNIGCVKLTEKYISQQPTSHEELQTLTSYIQEHLQKARQLLPAGFSIQHILAVAGTPTTLVAAELGRFEASQIDGFKLTRAKLAEWLTKLQGASVEQKIEMGIPKGRADVILVGVIILLQTLETFGLAEIVVSTRGVRYGVALEIGRRFSF